MNKEEENVLHPFDDVDKIIIDENKEAVFDDYCLLVSSLEKERIISRDEAIATLNNIRMRLGLPFVDPFVIPNKLDNITL